MKAKLSNTQKQLIKFEKQLTALLRKYPGLSIYGDMNGRIAAYLSEEGPYAVKKSIALPSYVK